MEHFKNRRRVTQLNHKAARSTQQEKYSALSKAGHRLTIAGVEKAAAIPEATKKR
jgi:hypothetical protein